MKLQLLKINNKFWNVKEFDATTQQIQPIQYTLEDVVCPFSMEQKYQDYIIKIQITESIQEFIETLEANLLQEFKNKANIQNVSIQTQIIRSRPPYPNLLQTKIYKKKKNIQTVVFSESESVPTIYSIQKNIKSIVIFIDTLYYDEKKYKLYYKWKIRAVSLE